MVTTLRTFCTARTTLLLVVFCLWLPGVVLAQNAADEPTAFQLQRFRPQGDPEGTFQLQSGKTLKTQWKLFASFFLHYSKDPLLLRNLDGSRRSDGDVLSHQLGADLLVGVAVLKWLDVRLRLPMTLYQSGRLPDLASFGAARGRDLSGGAFGDMSLMGKAQILHQKKYYVDLSLQLELGLPTGNAENFNGEGSAWVGFQVFVSRTFLKDKLFVAFNLGYRYLPPTTIFNLQIANELSYALSAKYRLLPGKLDLIAELVGATALSELTSAQTSPFDWAIGARWRPFKRLPALAFDFAISSGMSFGYGSPQIRLLAGVTWVIRLADADKDGVLAQWDRCPSRFGPKANNGCPWPDKDGDGVPDKADKCPTKKGVAARKGCPLVDPKKDTDNDGIPDVKDKCPKKDGPLNNKGCPVGDTDGDGLSDDKDRCPKKKGDAANAGCPVNDSDGDGVADNADPCPFVPATSLAKRKKASKRKKTSKRKKAAKSQTIAASKRAGCPLRELVKVSKEGVVLLKPVSFRTPRSSRLSTASKAVLQQLADVLKASKQAVLNIETHTDNSLGRRKSLFLSIRQALALKQWFVKAGVSAKRINARGFGASKPLLPNNSARGRRKNRRILFFFKGL
jgi:outer membrane protein OmpA-like peptidoglycan-associated protein